MTIGRRRRLAAAGLALLMQGFMEGAATPAAPFSGFSGRWRTDLSSLKFSSAPEVATLKDGVYACRSCEPPYSLIADGRFHRVAGYRSHDEARVNVVDARTIRISDRKAGRITHSAAVTVSRDGRKRTIAWADFFGPGSPDISGSTLQVRLGPEAKGAHRVSGSWRSVALLGTTDAARTETLEVEDGFMTMARATGESYRARIDGGAAPYRGDPSIDHVRLKSAGPRVIVEQHLHRGVVTSILTMRLFSDKAAVVFEARDPKTGRSSSARASKL